MKRLFMLEIIILVSVIVFVMNNPLKQEDSLEEVYNMINDTDISFEFFNWVHDNYGNQIIEIIAKDGYDDDIWYEVTGYSKKSLLAYYNKELFKDFNDKNKLSFVGDVSLADNFEIMPVYDSRAKGVLGILSEEVINIFDDSVTIVNNEFTVSSRGEALPGKLYTFRAKEERLNIYKEMHVDLVTLANNHVYDYGEDAFSDMLQSFKKYDIPYIGAGNSIEEAMRPIYFIINGYKVAFLNATRAEKNVMTPEATSDKGGVFKCYDSTNLINKITKVKENSDFVIVLVHYGKEDSTELEVEQIDSSHKYIEAGADLIVGTHAHVLQGMEIYSEHLIVYNLGDFIFNSEDKDTAILMVTVLDDGSLSYEYIPCRQRDEYTFLLKEDEKKRVIDKINNLSRGVKIDSDGKVIKE